MLLGFQHLAGQTAGFSESCKTEQEKPVLKPSSFYLLIYLKFN